MKFFYVGNNLISEVERLQKVKKPIGKGLKFKEFKI